MKSILLASASVVAFAGAAMAEVTFSGDATLGYNDDSNDIENVGFYWSANVAVTLSQTLNNGLTATATFDFDVADDNDDEDLGQSLASGGYLLELASESSSLQFGNVEFAAVDHWNTGGAQLTSDGFSERDDETVLRGNITYGGVEASLSYIVADDNGDPVSDDLDQLSIGASATFGNFNVGLAYQEEADTAVVDADGDGDGFNPDSIFGISAGTTFGGADVLLTYAQNTTDDTDSIGVSVSYPFGPVALRGWIASNSDHDDLSYGIRAIYTADAFSVTAIYESRGDTDPIRWSLEGSYDVGNGITVFAGVLGRDVWAGEAFYVAGEMELGENSTLLVSYVDADDTNAGYLADDEVGANAYQNGITAEVTFTF